MDVSSDYFPLGKTRARADTRAQQIARLMNEAGPQAFADHTNRLERSVQ